MLWKDLSSCKTCTEESLLAPKVSILETCFHIISCKRNMSKICTRILHGSAKHILGSFLLNPACLYGNAVGFSEQLVATSKPIWLGKTRKLLETVAGGFGDFRQIKILALEAVCLAEMRTLSNWTWLMMGPCSMPLSHGLPTFLLEASSAAFFTNSS